MAVVGYAEGLQEFFAMGVPVRNRGFRFILNSNPLLDADQHLLDLIQNNNARPAIFRAGQ